MCNLRVRFRQSQERRGIFNYSLVVEVLSSVGIPCKIFVYHQLPPDLDGNMTSVFDHVSTPVDLHEIPEDAASDTVPWFRTDKFVAWFRNMSDLDMAKQMMVDDIASLQKTYDVLTSVDNFERQTTLEFSEGNVTSVSNEE